MGLLDEAIREHLDLKRQHGAAEDELARQEAEALGPVTEADVADRQEAAVEEPEDSDGEVLAGGPFDRVAENELADEPEEPSFEWGERDSRGVEVPSFVPAEPMSDPAPDAEPEFVDAPTAAFDVLAQPVSEEDDELAAPEPSIPLDDDPLAPEELDAGRAPAGPETEFMPPPGLKIDDRPEREPLDPEPPALETPPPVELSEPEPLEPDDPVELSEPEPLEPDDPVEVEVVRAEEIPVETEPPLSEPEPLEPYPLESIEVGPDPLEAVAAPEPEPSADPGEAPAELDPGLDLPPEEEPPPAESGAFAPEPPLLEESVEPPLEEGPPPIGPEPSVRLDPTAEQGNPPGTAGDPLHADPPTQAWSIEDEVEDDLGPVEVAPIDERPVFEPLPDAEDGSDEALAPPSDHRLDLDDPVDADLDAAPAEEEEPPPREQPPAARGFFEETEEHETLWHEERPGADPDFEN